MTVLSQIEGQSISELASLPAAELQKLQDSISAHAKFIKSCNEKLTGAIAQKYSERMTQMRQDNKKGRPIGTPFHVIS